MFRRRGPLGRPLRPAPVARAAVGGAIVGSAIAGNRNRRNNGHHDTVIITSGAPAYTQPAAQPVAVAAAQPVAVAAAQPQQQNVVVTHQYQEVWACPRCTMNNQMASPSCVACRTPNPAIQIQQPPPQYQQGPPQNYQQAPPQNYQQAPPQNYQQALPQQHSPEQAPQASDNCGNCSQPLHGMMFCGNCGTKKVATAAPPRPAAPAFCTACGSPNTGAPFCGSCGTKFESSSAPATSSQHLPTLLRQASTVAKEGKISGTEKDQIKAMLLSGDATQMEQANQMLQPHV